MTFLLSTLAVWRMASLFANEDGPWDSLNRLRERLGVRYDAHSQPYGTTMLSRGILCVWCNSVWFGLLFALLYWFQPHLTNYITLPLALSAGAIALHSLVTRSGYGAR